MMKNVIDINGRFVYMDMAHGPVSRIVCAECSAGQRFEMKKAPIELDPFAREFMAFPDRRDELIAGLIASRGRFLLNLPGRGAARLISERLREGTFSAFYDFEMLLARRLHPRLADLKLNIIADIRVNALFDERYRPYEVHAAAALAKSGGMSRLREVITRMVGREGHRMALKFCDLVVRWADTGLYRTMRPVEACVMSMKDGGRSGEPPGFDRISGLYRELAAKEGESVVGALLARMEWDSELREFVPGLEEAYRDGEAARDETASGDPAVWQDEAEPYSGGTLDSGEISSITDENATREKADRTEKDDAAPDAGHGSGGETERPAAGVHADETRTRKYARILQMDYLDRKSPGDEAGIRRLMEKIEEKNGKAFGEARAAAIVDEVLAIWAGDISIDSVKRSLIQTIREERRPGPAVEYAAEPNIDDMVMNEGEEMKTAASYEEEPVSTGEMEAGGGRTGQAPDEDSFLIEDLIKTDSGIEKSDTGGGSDESYLIGNDPIMEDPEVEPLKEAPSPDEDGTVDSIEVFTIKDEVLFQDNPEKRRKTMRERSMKGMRITKIDLSGPDES